MNDHTCPNCGGELVQRNGRKGPFWGCSNYINGCRFTASMEPQPAPYRGMNPAPPYQPSRTARYFNEFPADSGDDEVVNRFAPNLLHVLDNFKLIMDDMDEFQGEALYDMLNLLNNKYPNDREILKLFEVARVTMQSHDSRRSDRSAQPDPTPAPVAPTPRKGRRSK